VFLIRYVNAMARVFPKHPAIDNLVKATTSFHSSANAFEPGRRGLFQEAVMDLGDLAALNPSVLEIRKQTR